MPAARSDPGAAETLQARLDDALAGFDASAVNTVLDDVLSRFEVSRALDAVVLPVTFLDEMPATAPVALVLGGDGFVAGDDARIDGAVLRDGPIVELPRTMSRAVDLRAHARSPGTS